MLLQLLDCELYESVFHFIAGMRFHLIYEHSLRIFLSLLEILVDGRDGLAVLDLEILELGVWMLFDLLSFHIAVVIYDEDSVRSHIHIEFAAPESCFLSASECCKRVLCIACLFAVPESSVSYDSCLFLCGCCDREEHNPGENSCCEHFQSVHYHCL